MQGVGTAPPRPQSIRGRAVAVVAFAHAIFVASWWWVVLYAEISPSRLSEDAWIFLAWAWLGWPATLIFRRFRVSADLVVAIVFGGVLIVPSVPFIYATTVVYFISRAAHDG